MGALSVDRLSHDEVSLDEDVRLLTIIASMLAQAVRMRQAAREQYESLERENARLHSELAQRFRPANIIGNSAEMARLLAEIAQVAGSPTTALIRGESGVGKELGRPMHSLQQPARRQALRAGELRRLA